MIEADDLGDGIVEALCRIPIVLELDLNDGEDNTAKVGATMYIRLRIDTLGRRVVDHHIQDAENSAY